MRTRGSPQAGSTLIEVVIASLVLMIGALGAAQVFTQGMQRAASSPGDLIATQKAAEAIESVFAARDTQKLTWAQIRNVRGETGVDGGVFLDAAQGLRDAGADGVINTADDGAVEEVRYPGPDRIMGTTDDQFTPLNTFQREIKITQVSRDLRLVAVTVTYQSGPQRRTYTLRTFISNHS